MADSTYIEANTARGSALPTSDALVSYTNDPGGTPVDHAAPLSMIRGGTANSRVVTNEAELTQALTDLGDRRVLQFSGDFNIFVPAGSNQILFLSGTASDHYHIDWLIRIDGQAQMYKAREVLNSILIYGEYHGPALNGTYTVEGYAIDYASILLMPGEYSGRWNMQPGISLVGFDRSSVVLNENNSQAPVAPICNWGENYIYNMTLSPTRTFESLDEIVSLLPVGGGAYDDTIRWSGQTCGMIGCNINAIDAGDHAGGFAGLPMLPQGTTVIRDCVMFNENCFSMATTPAIATLQPNKADTLVEFSNNFLKYKSGTPISQGGINFPYSLMLNVAAHYILNNNQVLWENLGFNGGGNEPNPNGTVRIGAFAVTPLRAGDDPTDSLVDIIHHSHIVDNGGEYMCSALVVEVGCEVNVTQCDLEAKILNANTGTVDPTEVVTGIYVNHVDAVVNVRGSRISGKNKWGTPIAGSQYSILCDAGTVNVDTASTTVGGPTGGAGTINLNTDT